MRSLSKPVHFSLMITFVLEKKHFRCPRAREPCLCLSLHAIAYKKLPYKLKMWEQTSKAMTTICASGREHETSGDISLIIFFPTVLHHSTVYNCRGIPAMTENTLRYFLYENSDFSPPFQSRLRSSPLLSHEHCSWLRFHRDFFFLQKS